MFNRLLYNVAVCPWPLDGPKHGCTIPGTDNEQADTSLNQVINHPPFKLLIGWVDGSE